MTERLFFFTTECPPPKPPPLTPLFLRLLNSIPWFFFFLVSGAISTFPCAYFLFPLPAKASFSAGKNPSFSFSPIPSQPPKSAENHLSIPRFCLRNPFPIFYLRPRRPQIMHNIDLSRNSLISSSRFLASLLSS